MLIIRLKAGLGNQMFQYAFGRVLSLQRNEELFLDLSAYENIADRDTPREYKLDNFNIKAKKASQEQVAPYITKLQILKRKIERNLFYRNNYKYHRYITNSKSEYFEGWWQNEEYFVHHADIIRSELSLKEPLSTPARSISQSIDGAQKEGSITVSIHVRRGDYVTNPFAATFHGVVDIAYYEKAIAEMHSRFPEKKLVFFIFSDDINWARENIIKNENSVYVSGPDIAYYEEIHLMSLCDHHIIANSSFSWWGAWLNPKQSKVVIAPSKWANDTSIDTSSATPPSWIRI